MIELLTDCSPPAKPWRSRQAMASTAHRVTRKNPGASGPSVQPTMLSGSPGSRGPV